MNDAPQADLTMAGHAKMLARSADAQPPMGTHGHPRGDEAEIDRSNGGEG